MTSEASQQREKVMLTLPASLKKRLMEIKKRQRWRDAAKKARKHYLEDEKLRAWNSMDGEDFREY